MTGWQRCWNGLVRLVRGDGQRARVARRSRSPLHLELLENRLAPANVNWTGGGDGTSWSDKANWGGSVPGSGDDVTINTAAAATVSIASGVSASVHSLTTGGNDTLSISGGSLTVASSSTLSGSLMMADATLTVSGGTVTVTGSTTINSSSLYVSGGGTLSLPRLTTFAKPDNLPAVFQASGAGSVLDVSALASVGAVTHYYWDVQAQQGGQVKLSALAAIGNASVDVNITADGSGSRIDLSSLTSFASPVGSLAVTHGGTVLDPKLTALSDVSVTLDGSGTVATGQWASLTDGSLTVTGGSYSLTGLADGDGSSLYVSGGATLGLPKLTAYAKPDNLPAVFQASGAGSTLDVSALASLGAVTTWYWNVQAQQGGLVKLGGLTSIGSASVKVNVSADGSGSRIDLAGLASFASPDGSLAVTHGGTVLDPKLTALSDVSVTLDGSGTVATGQWASLTDGSLTVTGGSYSLTGLADGDGSSLYVSGGATLGLPKLTAYAKPDNLPAVFQASGAGSTLDVSALASLGAVTTWYWNVQAQQGGLVKLGGLTSIGSASVKVNVSADGSGSRIDLAGLASFASPDGSLAVTHGGTVLDPKLTALSDVSVTLDGSGTVATGQWASLTDGSLTVTGGSYSLTGLADGDGSSLYVSGGATLGLPKLTAYAKPDNLPAVFQASGAGSTLDVSALASLGAVTTWYWNVQAQQGGLVKLGGLTSIGSASVKVNVSADGSGSRIDLAGLASFASPDGSLAVTHGGTVLDPKLTALSDVSVTLDGSGTVATGQWASLTDGSLTVTGGSYSLTGLADGDGSSLYVSGGATLGLPKLTAYAKPDNLPAVFQASGAGSVLDVSALASVGTLHAYYWDVQAQQGGQVKLSALASVGTNSPGVNLSADGSGSQIDVSGLTSFANGSFTLSNGGTILDPQLASFDNSTLTDSGELVTLTKLGNADSSKLYVNGGGTLALPKLTAYANPAGIQAYFQASGAGSVLDISALASVGAISAWFWDVQAQQGGLVKLSALASVGTNSPGVNLSADGSGSQIDVSGLTSFANGSFTLSNSGTILDPQLASFNNATLTDSGEAVTLAKLTNADSSKLYVNGGGTLALPKLTAYANPASVQAYFQASGAGSVLDISALTSVGAIPGWFWDVQAQQGGLIKLSGLTSVGSGSQNVYLSADGSGSEIDVSALTSFASPSGSFALSNGGIILDPQLASFNNATLTDSGEAVTLAKLSNADSSKLYVNGGGTLALPKLTAYANPAGVQAYFQASGVGSVLDISALASVGAIPGWFWDVQAQQGGLVKLSGLASVGSGSQNVYLSADGSGSEIDVSALTSFASPSGSFALSNGGIILDPQLASFNNATLTDSGEAVTLAKLSNADSSQLYVNGGGTLALPRLTAFANPAGVQTFFRASGAGSVLDVSALASVGAIPGWFWDVQAQQGGQVKLSALTAVGGSSPNVNISADGSGSLIDLSAMTTFASPGGSLAATNGGTLLDGSLAYINNAKLTVAGSVTVGNLTLGTNATLTGTGTLTGNVVNAGTVTLTGQLTVTGNYTQTSGGVLNVTLGGLQAGTQYGQLAVTGSGSLNGALNVALAPGFTPALGNSFQILTFAALTGYFSSATGLRVAPQVALIPSVNATNLGLTAAPLLNIGVSGVTAPPSGLTGAYALVSWTDQNNTAGPISGPWLDNVYAAADAQGHSQTLLGSFAYNGTLAAGASVTLTHPVALPPTAGTYWLVVSVNAFGPGPSSGTGTMVAPGSTVVTPAPLPDLRVDSITPPASGVLSGTSVPVTFVVTNHGTAPTSVPVWQDWVILSQDSTLAQTYFPRAGDDLILNNQPVVVGFNNPSYLDVGQSYQQTVNVPLPISAQGTWYVYVVPDGTGNYHPFAMPELSRTDKLQISAAFNVTLSPAPALAVTRVAVPPQDFSGQPMQLTWTVTNTGPGPTATAAWTDTVYVSTKATFDSSAVPLGSFAHQGALAPGASYTTTQTVTLPAGASGAFYFLVKTDMSGQVFQNGATANNIGATTKSATVNLTPPPQLQASVTPPASGVAGHALTFTYHVTNAGAGTTLPGSWLDSFYLSASSTFNLATATFLGSLDNPTSLDPGAHYDGSFTATLPNGLSGTYYLFAVADSPGTVFELNRSGNVSAPAAVPINSQPADLAVTATAPTTGQAGGAVRVNWTVTNQGAGDTIVSGWQDAVYADTSATLSGTAVLLGTYEHDGLLNPSGSYMQSQLVPLPITLQGAYNLFVVTNVGGKGAPPGPVYETNLANDTSAPQPITIAQQLAALQVTTVNGPATAVTGGQAAVSWTVKNAGAGATNANSWEDDVWLSTNAMLGSGGTDVKVGAFQHTNPLAAGASFSVSQNVTVPPTLAAGSYFVIVVADQAGQVVEGSGASTQRAEPTATAVSLGPVPDLTVSGVSVQGPVTSGTQMNVSWQVTNNGADTGAVPITDAVFLSYNQFLDPSSRYLGSVKHPGGLAHGASYSVSNQPVQLPAGVAGTFYVFVVTDSDGSIFERNATDNTAYTPQPVAIQLPPPVDLVAGAVTVPANAVPGEDITITYQVTNKGASPANGAWYDSLYLSPTQSWSVGDPFLGHVYQVRNLAANGGMYTDMLKAPLPAVAPGSYYVILRSNILVSIPESNLANNLSASLQQTAIDAPALTLGTPTNGTLTEGQSAYDRVVVTAGQTLQIALTSQTATAANELYVSFGTMPTRASYDFRFGQPLAANQLITVPSTQAGTYYLLTYGASVPGGPENYALTASLIPFSVTAVTPGTVSNTALPIDGGTFDRATVAITGARFDRDTTFQLVQGMTVIPAAAVTVQDGATSFATFNLAGVAAGTYDVQATHLDGTTVRLTGGLTVTGGAAGQLDTHLSAPARALVNRVDLLQVVSANTGGNDVPAPLVFVTSPSNTPIGLTTAGIAANQNVYFLPANPSGPGGVLSPGSQGSVSVYFHTPATAGAPNDFQYVTATADNTQPLTWSEVLTWVYADRTQLPNWPAVWANLQQRIGPTWGDYVQMLDRNAALWPTPATGFYDPTVLLDLEVQKAVAAVSTSLAGTLHVSDPGVAIAGRTVYAVNSTTGAQYAVSTRTDGSFLFDTIPAGTYTFAVDGLLLTTNPTVTVAGGQAVTGTMLSAVAGAQIAGAVFDQASNLGIAGGTVQATNETTGTEYFATADAKGNYVLAGLPAGVYDLRADAAGHARTFLKGVDVTSANATRALGLSAEAVISGTVTLQAGGPAQGTLTVFAQPAGNTDSNQAYVTTTTTLIFQVHGLPAGTYQVTVAMPGYAPQTFANETVTAGAGLDLGTITLAAGSGSAAPPTDPQAAVEQQHLAAQQQLAAQNAAAAASLARADNFPAEAVGTLFAPQPPAIAALPQPPLDIPPGEPVDPNDIVGPAGTGPQHFVPPAQLMPYEVRYQNLPPPSAPGKAGATYPAVEVTIQEALDPGIDPRSFRLGQFGFGGTIYTVPANRASYQTLIPQASGFPVLVTATIDLTTGVATWDFSTIDPNTGELATNPADGFLPPDNAAGAGEGFVSYTVVPAAADPTGTQVNAQAAVTFSTQPTLNTPQYSNTIDAGTGLTSAVTPLPAAQKVTTFPVSWSGTDNAAGSAVSSYTIYVSDNGGPATAWLTNTTLTSAPYTGQDGHAYSFTSFATDNAGNVQQTSTPATTLVDTTPPTSAVAALKPFSTSSIALSWSGSDPNNGSGVATYTVYVSDNGGAFTAIAALTNTRQTAGIFTGQDGHSYAFYTLATDNAGNVQKTPQAVPAMTLVDADPPTSAIGALPAVTNQAISLHWTGSDPAPGPNLVSSGVASYTIYASDNGGPFTPIAALTNTTQTSGSFTGQDGHSYRFYSLATDNAGNVQAPPTTPPPAVLVDLTLPTSAVSALPTYTGTTSIALNWSGSDPAPAQGLSSSGLATYTIYVSDNGGAYTAIAGLTNTAQTTGTFTGQPGHSYAFYSLATDNAGNVQTTPQTTPAGTAVVVVTVGANPPIVVTAGHSYSGVVATFPGLAAGSPAFTASIDWGDGQTSAGTIAPSGPGFTVSGSHTYAAEGRDPVTVTLTDAHRATVAGSGLAHVDPASPPPPASLDFVSFALTTSTEYYSNFVTNAYQTYLHRAPDGPGLAGWVQGMKGGLVTDEQLEAFFIGSAEYIASKGAGPGNWRPWVVSMYQDLLGRTPSDAEAQQWVDGLNAGISTTFVAHGFAASAERESDRVAADYQKYLGRAPTTAEVQQWVSAFVQGWATNEYVIAGFVGSAEYFADHYGDAVDYLFSAYSAILNRNPDPASMQNWLAFLEGSEA